MKHAQKIIKYLAIAFAIFLIFSIVSTAMIVIVNVSNVFSDDDKNISDLKDLYVDKNAKVLDIDIISANLIIKTGSELKIETNDKNIIYEHDGNKIKIKEKNYDWFKLNKKSSLVVYIPKDYIFDGVSISNGAGKVTISEINTDYFTIDLGAGKVKIDKLNVSSETIINGGAGEVSILDGTISNLDLDMGVGKMSIKSKLLGDSKIDAGVGEFDLKLLGTEKDYKIDVDKGIGTFKIDNNEVKDNTIYGNGLNKVDIDGGVGNISIKFSD